MSQVHVLDVDIRTLLLLLAWGNLFTTGLLFSYRGPDEATRRHYVFGAGRLLQALAWFLLAQRGAIPDIISADIGNSFLLLGYGAETFALISIFESPTRWGRIQAAACLCGIGLFWAFAGTGSQRVVIGTGATAALYLPVVAVMLRSRPRSALQRATLGLIVTFVFVLSCRVWMGLTTPTFALLSPGVVQTITFFVAVLTMFVGSIAFLLLLKEREDQKVKESEEKYRALVETTRESIIIVQDGRIMYVNQGLLKLLSLNAEDMLGRPATEFVNPLDRALFVRNYTERISGTDSPAPYEIRLIDRHGAERWVFVSGARIVHAGRPASMAVLTDITARRQREAEREHLIGQLQVALQEKKTLSGLLPICAHCKKIRDDQGYWNKLEEYIHAHAEVEFSHGLCPECLEKYFPEPGRNAG